MIDGVNDEHRRHGLVPHLPRQEGTRDERGVRGPEADETSHGELVGFIAVVIEDQTRVGGQQHRDFDLVADRHVEPTRHRRAEQHASVAVFEEAARGHSVGMEGRARLVAADVETHDPPARPHRARDREHRSPPRVTPAIRDSRVGHLVGVLDHHASLGAHADVAEAGVERLRQQLGPVAFDVGGARHLEPDPHRDGDDHQARGEEAFPQALASQEHRDVGAHRDDWMCNAHSTRVPQPRG